MSWTTNCFHDISSRHSLSNLKIARENTATIPWLIGVHCVAYNLELAVLDGIKDVQYFFFFGFNRNAERSVQTYHDSAKALRKLQELCNIMDKSYNRSVNLTGSRWVPQNFRALKVVCNKFRVIHAHIHRVVVATSSATMQGRERNVIAKRESYKHIALMFFMLGILDELQKLSLTF